ncbi:MAG: hypothetical protein V4633_13980 [Pseudomonadota bacterium]
MNASKLFAAVAVFAVAGSTFAADLPAANAAVTAAAAATTAVSAAANTGIAAASLNVPAVTITRSLNRSRADAHAEAVEFVKNHKTAFATLLEHSKN